MTRTTFGTAAAVATALLLAPSAGTAQEVETDDLTLDIGGYGSFRWEANDSEDVPASITFRRFVVTTDARWKDRLRVYSEIEYERLSEIEVERGVTAEDGGLEFEQELEGTNGSEIAVEQAWGQWDFTDAVGLRFGAVLPPIGRFNVAHDDNVWNFPRRPLSVRGAHVLPVSAAWTELGIGLVGEAYAGEIPIRWQAYVMNGVSLDFAIEQKVVTRDPARDKLLLEAVVSPTAGAFDGSNATDAFSGRVSVSPTIGTELGVSGYAGDYTPDYLATDASIRTLGVDGRVRLGPAYLEGEYLHTTYGDLDAVLADFASVAREHATETESDETADLESEIEIEVDGVSDTRSGFWLDLGWPIALPRGTWGLDDAVLVPVVRFERVAFDGDLAELDFTDGTVTELEKVERTQRRISAGVAFRPIPQAVFHLVWERNDAVDGGLIDPAVGEDATNAVTFGMAVGF